MNQQHKLLLAGLVRNQRRRAHSQSKDSYLSSGHRYYDVSVPVRRTLAKAWLKDNREIADREFVAVLDSLMRGKSHEEKTLACILLAYHHSGRKSIGPKRLGVWLDHLVGWAEIDSLCANVFKAEEMLAEWTTWKRFIEKLARDRNINKRRAALVFLTGPARYSVDVRFADLGFATIEALKHERDIMITKAISWLLRSMLQNHRSVIIEYIQRNGASLPAVAVRETNRKIQTGRK